MTTIFGLPSHRRGSDDSRSPGDSRSSGSGDSRDDSGYDSGSRSSGGDAKKIIEGFTAHGHGGAAITKNKTVIICFGKPEDGERKFTADGIEFTFESIHTKNRA